MTYVTCANRTVGFRSGRPWERYEVLVFIVASLHVTDPGCQLSVLVNNAIQVASYVDMIEVLPLQLAFLTVSRKLKGCCSCFLTRDAVADADATASCPVRSLAWSTVIDRVMFLVNVSYVGFVHWCTIIRTLFQQEQDWCVVAQKQSSRCNKKFQQELKLADRTNFRGVVMKNGYFPNLVNQFRNFSRHKNMLW